MNQIKEERIKTISLFSGAGGLDLGLRKAGFNVVFANDILKAAIENYRYNLGPISNGDNKTLIYRRLNTLCGKNVAN
ncbi:DNA cytosine methyltransferase [Oenococcus oeni]|nr:DNA cytosine methyltransferase [Oenococcus oeni]TEU59063.1 DNA cytosine methyltransferase [Oenococcus oeni]TEU59298.1 DNA cytosine methyltransferase [Oenococcus oeni]